MRPASDAAVGGAGGGGSGPRSPSRSMAPEPARRPPGPLCAPRQACSSTHGTLSTHFYCTLLSSIYSEQGVFFNRGSTYGQIQNHRRYRTTDLGTASPFFARTILAYATFCWSASGSCEMKTPDTIIFKWWLTQFQDHFIITEEKNRDSRSRSIFLKLG